MNMALNDNFYNNLKKGENINNFLNIILELNNTNIINYYKKFKIFLLKNII